jgi:Universal stress protein family
MEGLGTYMRGNGMSRILAFIDLSSPQADKAVENALILAETLGGEVTLLSVIERTHFERGRRDRWPPNAFGNAHRKLDIHRVVLPGMPAETISVYADQIRADIVLIPPEYSILNASPSSVGLALRLGPLQCLMHHATQRRRAVSVLRQFIKCLKRKRE